MDFVEWLETEKGFSRKGAIDVRSRTLRVKEMLQIKKITAKSIADLNELDEFQDLSASIKSQLRRACRLYLEYSSK